MALNAKTFFAQLPFTLQATSFPGLGTRYSGKVRDSYRAGDRLVMVTTDRLSAFDRNLTTLPFKGDILNTLACFWFKQTQEVLPNHLLSSPDPAVMVAQVAKPFPVEFVVRGYLAGSLWRDYTAGRDSYDLRLRAGMKENQQLDRPVVTPSTKAPAGEHDAPRTPAQVVDSGLLSQRDWQRSREAALALFAAGQRILSNRGLILADTKYELGLVGDKLLAIDEMHTPDSSRFWIASEYEERFRQGVPQAMLDKEIFRQWLIQERGFYGDGETPEIPDKVRVDLALAYARAFEEISGTVFPLVPGPVQARIAANLASAGLV